MPPTHPPKMSANATAAASSVALIPSQRSSSLFPSPFARLQTSFNHQRFLSRSFSCRAPARRRLVTNAALAADPAEVEKKRVLILNTNSGGHAVIGFYFARELLGAGHEVTVLTVGEEASDKMKKPPFTRFSELASAGGRTVWGDPAEVGKIVGSAGFDVVLDNNGKDLDAVIPVADWAKSAGVKQFLFISSAGIYKTSDEVPHVEGDPVKGDAGHVAVERYIADLSFSNWAIFRPQYMIGSGNNKDCEEWFFDRIVRGRPVPIPGSGVQLTNISHVRDVSSMLSLAVANPIVSSAKIFNCVSDRAVTFNGLVKLCAQAAGLEAKIVHYDPKSIGIDAKKAFPFRNMVVDKIFSFLFFCLIITLFTAGDCLLMVQHFFAEPRTAKEILGWTSTTNLHEDLKERFVEYVAIGRDKKQIKFDIDDKILESLKLPVAV